LYILQFFFICPTSAQYFLKHSYMSCGLYITLRQSVIVNAEVTKK